MAQEQAGTRVLAFITAIIHPWFGFLPIYHVFCFLFERPGCISFASRLWNPDLAWLQYLRYLEFRCASSLLALFCDITSLHQRHHGMELGFVLFRSPFLIFPLPRLRLADLDLVVFCLSL